MSKSGINGVHDVGGSKVLVVEKLCLEETPMSHWQLQIHALLVVLCNKKMMSTDELRRGIEALEPEAYKTWGYYDKWSASISMLLLERKVITQEDLDSELGSDERATVESTKTIFKIGDVVRVREEASKLRWRRPHVRCPGYIYGQVGKVEEVVGEFEDPFLLAFRGKGPKQLLYRVCFSRDRLWDSSSLPLDIEKSWDCDTVQADIYQDWLEPFNPSSSQTSVLAKRKHPEEPSIDHSATHHHAHSHDHDHVHQDRFEVECTAVEREGTLAETPGRVVGDALLRCLRKKGVVSPEELQRVVEKLEAADADMLGARLVVEAWRNPDFKTRLLENAHAAAESIGVSTSNPNAPTVLKVVANTPTVHNVVVCTLCSCYPTSLLGFSPAWYKSRAYRARMVMEPREVLKEFGTDIPSQVRINVLDSTADCRYLVVPLPPKELTMDRIKGMAVEELQKLVTRDSMIGVRSL